jgi:hypothetical protein
MKDLILMAINQEIPEIINIILEHKKEMDTAIIKIKAKII